MKPLARMLLVVTLLIAGLIAAFLWMAQGLQSPTRVDVSPIHLTQVEPTTTDTATLTVVTYNIGWAYGMGSEGTGSVKSPEAMREGLDRIAKAIDALDPDIVLLQEVDFDCGRSHGVDQAKVIAEAAGLPYIGRGVSWRNNYLPFPYWPPKDHWGRMLSGGAILSRHPIKRCWVETFDKPASNSFIYNLGYPFRYLQRCDVEIGGEVVPVYSTHLEAFDATNRAAQARRVAEILSDEVTPRSIFGGDLNCVPPEAPNKKGFVDDPEYSFEGDPTIQTLRDVKGLSDTVPPHTYATRPGSYVTFPADEPTRKLDYVFAGSAYQVTEARAVREAGDPSDHAPVIARLRVKSN